MKTSMLITIALAFSISAMAQYTAPVIKPPYKKAIAACVAPSGEQKMPKDYFKMESNRMYLVKDGTPYYMTGYRFLKDGTVVDDGGVVLTNEGKKIYLRNGESIDGNGTLTSLRCAEFTSIAEEEIGTCSLE